MPELKMRSNESKFFNLGCMILYVHSRSCTIIFSQFEIKRYIDTTTIRYTGTVCHYRAAGIQ